MERVGASNPTGAVMKKKIGTPQILRCSFCGRGQDEVTKLISGPSVFICDECVGLCVKILGDEAPAPA